MPLPDPDLRRTWLFGPGADAAAHDAMLASGADALIVDLEDFTPAPRRPEARALLARFVAGCRQRGRVAAVRVNALEGDDGAADLEAAMSAGADVIAYPMAERAAQIQALHAAVGYWEARLGLADGSTELLPVCETALGVADLGLAEGSTELLPVCEKALGVADVRAIAAASARVRSALLGAEDLANDLCAERAPDALELDHARRRFVLDCRAARIEPIDAPYTFSDAEGAAREARFARRLGYRSKSLVRPEHAAAINAAFTPQPAELARARALVEAFEAARARGEDRALFEGQWVEVPTVRNAKRLIERAARLGAAGMCGLAG